MRGLQPQPRYEAVNPMLGFKSFENARVVVAGIETRAEDQQETIRLATVGWNYREPRSRVAAGDGGLNTDGKEERFVLRLLGPGVCNRTDNHSLDWPTPTF